MASKRVKAALLAVMVAAGCAHRGGSGRDPVVWQAVLLGDPGWPGPERDAADDLVRAELQRELAPAVVLIPGDVFYEEGLPASCKAARARVEGEYTQRLPNLDLYVVPGNHDHGDPDGAFRPEVAHRLAYFDCQHRSEVASTLGWNDAAGCPCVARWHVPTGRDVVGVAEAGPLLVVGVDSQFGLGAPAALAQRLERVLEGLPVKRPALLVAHHPLESRGPHGQGPVRGSGDLESEAYRRYRASMSSVLETRASTIVLAVFGHEHVLDLFLDRRPPRLTAGAGSKRSPVLAEVTEGFAVGDAPGIGVVRWHRSGRFTLVLATPQLRRTFDLSNPR
jgi:hypothetical protein